MADSVGGTLSSYGTPCAQCGDILIAPIWSEHVDHRCVRHVWSCEACGYVFQATVYLSPERNTAADGRAAEIPARLRQPAEESSERLSAG